MVATAVETPRGMSAQEAPRDFFWSRWRYAGGKRDVRLDFLRGFAAFAMIVDHVSGTRSWLYFITGGDAFYASAAEAFVFISGLVLGIVYRDIIARHGIGAALSKSLKRAWTLYALTVFLTLSFAAFSSLLNLPWALHLRGRDAIGFVVGAFTLHQTFHLADVLLMYTFLLLGAGPLLTLLARGQMRWVLAGSWGLWLVWQIWPAQAQIPWAIAGNEVFKLAAWQSVFVTAVVIGYYRRALEQRLAWLPVEAVLVAAALLVAAAAVLYFHLLGSPYGPNPLAAQLFGKPDLRVGRLIVFAGVFSFAFALTTVFWQPIRALLGWLLLPLGHHALGAYAMHIFVVGLLWRLASQILGDNRSATLNSLIELTGVGIVWGAIVLWPAVGSVADCCRHCRRAGPFGIVRVFERRHSLVELGANYANRGKEAIGGQAEFGDEPGSGSKPADCGHPEPHVSCP